MFRYNEWMYTQEENQIEKYLFRYDICIERVRINYHICKKKIKFQRINLSSTFFYFNEIL